MSRAAKELLNTACIAVSILSFWIYLCSKTISTFGIGGQNIDDLFNADLTELVCFCIMIPTLLFSVRYVMARNRRDSFRNKYEAETLKLRMSAIDRTNAVIEFCPDGHVISINKKFMDAFHYGNDMIGKHHSILLPPGMADTETYKNFWNDLRRGESKQGNYHRINKYGGDVYIMGTYVPIFDKHRWDTGRSFTKHFIKKEIDRHNQGQNFLHAFFNEKQFNIESIENLSFKHQQDLIIFQFSLTELRDLVGHQSLADKINKISKHLSPSGKLLFIERDMPSTPWDFFETFERLTTLNLQAYDRIKHEAQSLYEIPTFIRKICNLVKSFSNRESNFLF